MPMHDVVPENNPPNHADPNNENVNVPGIRRYPQRQNRQVPARYR